MEDWKLTHLWLLFPLYFAFPTLLLCCREVFNELPMEFAAEVNQLMSLKLENSVG